MPRLIGPRIGFYADARSHEASEIAKLARADVIFGDKDPPTVEAWKAAIRARGGEPEVYCFWMCPWVSPTPGAWPWSLRTFLARVALAGDWYLRTPFGEPIGTWGALLLNMTRPTIRSAVGSIVRSYAALGRGGWTPWVPGGRHYDGLLLETVMYRVYRDWLRREGIGERVSAVDVDEDAIADDWGFFNTVWADGMAAFWISLRKALPDLKLIVGGDAMAPPTRTLHGLNIEDFGVRRTPAHDLLGTPAIQRGYCYARDCCLDGWNLTMVKGEAGTEAKASFLLALTALGDGIYVPTEGGKATTRWWPVYDTFRRLGRPLAAFESLGSSAYRRVFERGEVLVRLDSRTAAWSAR